VWRAAAFHTCQIASPGGSFRSGAASNGPSCPPAFHPVQMLIEPIDVALHVVTQVCDSGQPLFGVEDGL
jgi:hypothetical protein